MQFVVGVIAVVLVLYYFASRGDVHEQQAEDSENELLHLCLGDRKQAERLIALEAKALSGIKREEAVRRAIQSLKRDVRA